jgi:predicted O-methyltransferase YrrM
MPPESSKQPGAPLPDIVWGTKGFAFWTLLSLLLLEAAPSRILELGAGRSTLTLAEYAQFRKASLMSIETNPAWYHKVRTDLRGTQTRASSIRLVEIDPETNWYKLGPLREATQSGFDFVLVDGPNRINGDSMGMRDTALALEEIRRLTAEADIVIVDDVHRRHVLRTIEPMLVNPAQYEKHFLDYVVNKLYTNALCICTRKGSRASAAIGRVSQTLNITLYQTRTERDCPQD